jgi:hypothetical protein
VIATGPLWCVWRQKSSPLVSGLGPPLPADLLHVPLVGLEGKVPGVDAVPEAALGVGSTL